MLLLHTPTVLKLLMLIYTNERIGVAMRLGVASTRNVVDPQGQSPPEVDNVVSYKGNHNDNLSVQCQVQVCQLTTRSSLF